MDDPLSLDPSPSLEARVASLERRVEIVGAELDVVARRVERLSEAKQALVIALMDLIAERGGGDV